MVFTTAPKMGGAFGSASRAERSAFEFEGFSIGQTANPLSMLRANTNTITTPAITQDQQGHLNRTAQNVAAISGEAIKLNDKQTITQSSPHGGPQQIKDQINSRLDAVEAFKAAGAAITASAGTGASASPLTPGGAAVKIAADTASGTIVGGAVGMVVDLIAPGASGLITAVGAAVNGAGSFATATQVSKGTSFGDYTSKDSKGGSSAFVASSAPSAVDIMKTQPSAPGYVTASQAMLDKMSSGPGFGPSGRPVLDSGSVTLASMFLKDGSTKGLKFDADSMFEDAKLAKGMFDRRVDQGLAMNEANVTQAMAMGAPVDFNKRSLSAMTV